MSEPWNDHQPQAGITSGQAAQELLRRRAARASFLGYARYRQADNEQPAAHHQIVCDALDEVERGECDRLMIMMPPGSAKSTYASVLFPQYFIGRNPQLCVIGASHTDELASRFSRRVRNGVGDAEFRDLFPTVGVASDASNVKSWETTVQGEYKAVGVNGNIAGRRGDLLLIDDPVKSREDADSETKRETVWQWWLNDARTRLKPGGRVVLIMTRWHEDDLAGRLLEHEKGRWKVIKIPMEAGKDDVLGREPGERLWREWFTEQMLIDAKSDPRVWISLYQQEPRPVEGAEFKRSWLNYYDHWPAASNKIILIDPSAGKNTKSDFTSMWVFALGRDGNAYLVDGIRKRMQLVERTGKLFDLHERWKPLQVRYETYGMQADIEHIKSQMNTREYRFRLTEVGGALAKEDRIRRLTSWFEDGRIWFPRAMMRNVSPGVDEDLIKTFVEQEYVAFPVSKFDDAFDCMARLAEPTLSLPWPKRAASGSASDGETAMWGVLDKVTGY